MRARALRNLPNLPTSGKQRQDQRQVGTAPTGRTNPS